MNESKPTHSFWRSLWTLLCGGAILVLICAGAISWLFGGFGDPCANEITSTDVSPNGTLQAVLFRRDCGATTGYSTHVSIIPASRDLPNEGGNIFVQGGEPIVVVRWIDDQHLSISGGGAGTAFLQLLKFHDVRITYD